jgi:ABC-2 type transport system ATP-binding protein
MQETKLPAVTFDAVSLQIGKTNLLDDISLSIPSNTIAGILGPNGAGKTTLISLVIGLRMPTNGKITVLGQSVTDYGEKLREKIGVVLQETSLYEELTIEENLEFVASLYNLQSPKKRIEEVLDLLGLSSRAYDSVGILSGGLKRRVAIARALLHDPELLVVDEPTLGVDVETRHSIWSHLKYLRSKGHTILVASNYLDEAQAICDTVSVLNKGKLLVTESPEQLIARAGHSLDIECSADSGEQITKALTNTEGVIRTEATSTGVSVFITSDTIPDTIIKIVVKTAPLNSFKFRPADLAEVFRTLHAGYDENSTDLKGYFEKKSFFARHPILVAVMAMLILSSIVFLEVWFGQPQAGGI